MSQTEEQFQEQLEAHYSKIREINEKIYKKLPKHFEIHQIGLMVKTLYENDDMDDYGNRLTDTPHSIYDDDDAMEDLKLFMEIIPKCFIKHSEETPYWNVGSYAGKHRLEEYFSKNNINKYVSNGLFIMAMILLGYEFKSEFTIKYKSNGKMLSVDPNMVFNANYLYRNEIQCECGITYVQDQKYHHLKSKKHQKEMLKKETSISENILD